MNAAIKKRASRPNSPEVRERIKKGLETRRARLGNRAKTLHKEFGKSVVMRRQALGFTTGQLATVMNINSSTLMKFERGDGEIGLFDAYVLGHILGIQMQQFLVDVVPERKRLGEIYSRRFATLDDQIKQHEEALKALQEQKKLAARVIQQGGSAVL